MFLRHFNAFLGFYMVSIFMDISKCAEIWNMHQNCGGTILAYGGEIHFDTDLLSLQKSICRITLIGNGSDTSEETTMLSLYFSYFNITKGCAANLTISEEPYDKENKDLRESYCENSPYLNENLMFTTHGRVVSIKYAKIKSYQLRMKFVIKFVSFISRVGACTEAERENDRMYSCYTGRCVYKDLVCEDLNPCGDHSDCNNITQVIRNHKTENRGLHYVKFIIITIVVIFAIFAIIQICLVVKNEHKMCHWKDPKVRIEAELMPIPDGPKMKKEQRAEIECFIETDTED